MVTKPTNRDSTIEIFQHKLEEASGCHQAKEIVTVDGQLVL